MNILEIINKKRIGKRLSQDEINFFVNEYTNGSIPDYQMSSLLMAICTKGFNFNETLYMTLAMKNSGKVFNFDPKENFILDKHSTGGVSDSTSLIVLSVLTALGHKTIKMSGRSLGITGGTIDKLDVIKNIKYNLTDEEINKSLKTLGGCIISSDALAPADKKIYALRDVSGTVANISLITSSIVSKKLATGAHGIVLDVKCGRGAFMKTRRSAVRLGKSMLRLLKHEGIIATAMITDMSRPLGSSVGSAYEIADVIKVLNGEENALRKLSIEICVREILLKDPEQKTKIVRAKVVECLDNGTAKKQLYAILKNQGATLKTVDKLLDIPQTKYTEQIYAPRSGFLRDINAQVLGQAVSDFGGGRKNIGDNIVHNVGIELLYKPNQKVRRGAAIATIYHNDRKVFDLSREKLQNAFSVGFFPKFKPLIYKVIKQ